MQQLQLQQQMLQQDQWANTLAANLPLNWGVQQQQQPGLLTQQALLQGGLWPGQVLPAAAGLPRQQQQQRHASLSKLEHAGEPTRPRVCVAGSCCGAAGARARRFRACRPSWACPVCVAASVGMHMRPCLSCLLRAVLATSTCCGRLQRQAQGAHGRDAAAAAHPGQAPACQRDVHAQPGHRRRQQGAPAGACHAGPGASGAARCRAACARAERVHALLAACAAQCAG